MEIDNIYNCDCLEGMSELPTGHKYCIVTDPPFNVGYHYNEYKDNKSDNSHNSKISAFTFSNCPKYIFDICLIHNNHLLPLDIFNRYIQFIVVCINKFKAIVSNSVSNDIF